MRTRTPLLVLLGALAVVGLFEVGIRALEPRLPVLSEWPTVETELKNSQLTALADAPTVLIIGSSMTEAAVDPAQLVSMGAADAAYNAAFPFYSPATADVWLTEITRPWDGLEHLVIGLPAWPPPDDPADDSVTAGLRSVVAGADAEEAFPLALWRLRGVLADAEEAARRDKTRSGRLWTDLGHQTFYYDLSGRSLAGKFPDYGAPEMPDRHEKALRNIISAAREAGVTPVLLLEPGRFPDPIDDAIVAEYIEWLQALSDDLDVVLWNTYSIDWEQSLFADEAHFNQQGTIRFTEHLGNLMLGLSAGS